MNWRKLGLPVWGASIAIALCAVAFPTAHATTLTTSVTFTETGLPSFTLWSVTMNGATIASKQSSIQFTEPAGNFTFLVSHPAGYLATPRNGAVDTSSGTASVSIVFTPFGEASNITSNFNGNSIAAGDYIWFNSIMKPASSIPSTGVTVKVVSQTISFASGGTTTIISLPDTKVTYSPTFTSGSTYFNWSQNRWITTVPISFTDNVFLAGFAFQVPAGGLPGGIKGVTWTGVFAASVQNFSVHWQWAAAVYSNFTHDFNALDVKPLHSSKLDKYHSGDQAGTPEAYTSFVVGGARGGGGSNFTGSYSATTTVVLPLN